MSDEWMGSLWYHNEPRINKIDMTKNRLASSEGTKNTASRRQKEYLHRVLNPSNKTTVGLVAVLPGIINITDKLCAQSCATFDVAQTFRISSELNYGMVIEDKKNGSSVLKMDVLPWLSVCSTLMMRMFLPPHQNWICEKNTKKIDGRGVIS